MVNVSILDRPCGCGTPFVSETFDYPNEHLLAGLIEENVLFLAVGVPYVDLMIA